MYLKISKRLYQINTLSYNKNVNLIIITF